MYRLNQWAGDFPMLWEPHGSFTPLFTSQPDELAFSKSVSLHLHISASRPLSRFSLFLCCCFLFFSFFPPHLSYEVQHRQCRFVALSFTAGPLAAILANDRHTDKFFCLCWWIKLLHPIMIDHVWIQSGVLRSRIATDEKSLPDNSCQFLQFPMLSVAPFFSFTQLVKILHLLPPLLFFQQTF